MKRLTFIAFFLLGCLGLHAQNYVFEYDVEFFLNSGSRRFYNTLFYTTTNNPTKREIPAFSMS